MMVQVLNCLAINAFRLVTQMPDDHTIHRLDALDHELTILGHVTADDPHRFILAEWARFIKLS